MKQTWSPNSWLSCPIEQPIDYPDAAALSDALRELASLPPLVTSWEVERLKTQLADAQQGEAFVLQGGDCSETFADCTSDSITNKLKILLKMSLVLVYGTRLRVVRVGRFAGQYAKPRSQLMETRGGESLPSYRGPLINRRPFTVKDRTPDPRLLLTAFERSAMTLNFIRGLVDGGFADLHHPEFWDLGFLEQSAQVEEYRQITDTIVESVRFFEKITGQRFSELARVDFFTSHEGLCLPYEQAQTRKVPRREGWYNLATHFPWIGDRTRRLDGAHIEYFRGIENPVGVKVGPSMTGEELRDLASVLNPANAPGKLTLIHRFGAGRISDCLPGLIDTVQRYGLSVVWICDPMHGNTINLDSGVKTRNFDDIIEELSLAFDIHSGQKSRLCGVHFELTGENVTECIGGARGLAEEDLSRDYRSDVDPRLNYEQALEMALFIAQRMRKNGNKVGRI